VSNAPTVFALSAHENVRVAIDDNEVIIGVPDQKAVVIPIVLFAHIVAMIDELCTTNSIHMEEAALVTKH
jgi:hypothetical protein